MKKEGFTLAEILITLSIIGVVAALTIPSLVVKNQEKETVVQLKKAYNVFSNAFSLAVVEYGDPSGWGWGDAGSPTGANNVMDKFASHLNILKRCNQQKGCYKEGVVYKYLNGNNWIILNNATDSSGAILADGMSFSIYSAGNTCNNNYGQGGLEYTCGAIGVDINGFKGPNTMGKDFFEFHFTNNSIVPMGTPEDTQAPLSSKCVGGTGDGCTAWAILKENLNYPSAGTGWE